MILYIKELQFYMLYDLCKYYLVQWALSLVYWHIYVACFDGQEAISVV